MKKFIILICLVCFFLPEVIAQIHTEKGYYLIKRGTFQEVSNDIEIHFYYKGDKQILIKLIDKIDGVNRIWAPNCNKYDFTVYVAEAYDYKKVFWAINQKLKEYYKLDKKAKVIK